jgi:hypothetical protein
MTIPERDKMETEFVTVLGTMLIQCQCGSMCLCVGFAPGASLQWFTYTFRWSIVAFEGRGGPCTTATLGTSGVTITCGQYIYG